MLAICQRHQLTPHLKRSESGSHIVYRAGEPWNRQWIKLMAPIYQKEMAFEVAGLNAVRGQLSVPTPEIFVQESIEGWPYVILSDVPGESIKRAWPLFTEPQQIYVATQIAKIVLEMRQCRADDLIKGRFEWNSFVDNQYDQCEAQQVKKKLPEPWVQHLKNFLGSFSKSEFKTDQLVFLHCDLSYEHFLVSKDSDQPAISGIIDMADVQYGHPEYELAGPAVFVFKAQPIILSTFLRSCGYSPLNQRFSEKLLAWCLLHRYFDMYGFFTKEMDECVPGDFKSLAQKVFPL